MHMTFMDLGATRDFVESFGVIATLLYLAIQMRHNTKAIRLSSSHAVTGELRNMFGLLASDQGLADVFIEAGHKSHLQGSSRVRYYTFTSNLLRLYENAYLLKRENSISEAHWSGLTRLIVDYKAMTAFPEYWSDRKHWLSDAFQIYMTKEILPTPHKDGVPIPGSM